MIVQDTPVQLCAPRAECVPPAARPVPGLAALAWRSLADYVALAKPRISVLVLATTALGAVLGAASPIAPWTLLATLLGTGLAATGANTLNQWLERDRDALMHRTRGRPLPARRLPPSDALTFGVVTAVLGVALLAVAVNPLTAGLGAFTVVTYVLVYTPLKRRTWLSTLVGAVPGAIPPVMGVTSTGAGLDGTAAWLFAVLFVWQIPHFHAIAWLHRDDYARGGFPLLPVVDRDGRRTARQSVAWLVVMAAVGAAPFFSGGRGAPYLLAALLLGGLYFAAGFRFARRRDRAAARGLFLTSLVYLPALLAAAAALA